MAALASVSRPTWASLESGSENREYLTCESGTIELAGRSPGSDVAGAFRGVAFAPVKG